jgi:hypothetical protein
MFLELFRNENSMRALWSLTIRKKRTNGLSNVVKRIIINCMACETHISPNKKDVTQRKIGFSVYEESPTHYLMEIQVPLFFPPMLHFSVLKFLSRIEVHNLINLALRDSLNMN